MMKHDRLHALADGIFAIAMTLLVLELRVPEIHHPTNQELIAALRESAPAFIAFAVSFALLFTYWRAHNVLISVFAKNLDVTLVNINMLFLALISLIPFSAYLFGRFPETQVAVGVYAFHLVAIALVMYIMRRYILTSKTIENSADWSRRDHRNALIRTIIPSTVAVLSFALSYWNTKAAFILLLGIAFLNVFNRSFDPLFFFLDKHGIGIDPDDSANLAQKRRSGRT